MIKRSSALSLFTRLARVRVGVDTSLVTTRLSGGCTEALQMVSARLHIVSQLYTMPWRHQPRRK